MKELAEFHFIENNINLHTFLKEIALILKLKKSELHRIKVVASMPSKHHKNQKTFYVLFNDNHYYHALEHFGTYQGQWRWKIQFAGKSALLFTPPRGNSGFISKNLGTNEPRKEFVIKNRILEWSLFDALEEINNRIPTLLADIECMSLTRDLIFIQMEAPILAELLRDELKVDFETTLAHSRGYIISVDNYPVNFDHQIKPNILQRVYPPLK